MPRREEIPIEHMQKAYAIAQKEYGLTPGELARRLGWFRKASKIHTNGERGTYVVGDGTRVRRALGLTHWKKGGGGHYTTKSMSYDRAVKFILAMGLDPIDAGL